MTPELLAPLMAAAGIDRSIVVQTAENIAETDYLLGLADVHMSIAGVVGWVDFTDGSGPIEAERLARHPKLLGLRPMLQDLTDTGWLSRPDVQPTIRAMKRLGLRLDALIRPEHLRGLADFAAVHPDLPLVIDHAAKPLIAWRQFEPWAGDMRRIAAAGPVHCKLSGITNNAGDAWDAEKLKPWFDVLFGAFGPDRLMFGSDWPMIELVGSYAGWVDAVEALTADLPAHDRAMIFGGTAAAFYGVADA